MLGVLADAGLKDPKKLDCVDRYTLAEAGSPARDNGNPLPRPRPHPAVDDHRLNDAVRVRGRTYLHLSTDTNRCIRKEGQTCVWPSLLLYVQNILLALPRQIA